MLSFLCRNSMKKYDLSPLEGSMTIPRPLMWFTVNDILVDQLWWSSTVYFGAAMLDVVTQYSISSRIGQTPIAHQWEGNITTSSRVNTFGPRQYGRHFADDTFKCIFSYEYASISISLNCVSKGPFNDIPAWVQIMAWRRSGGKPLSEPKDG